MGNGASSTRVSSILVVEECSNKECPLDGVSLGALFGFI